MSLTLFLALLAATSQPRQEAKSFLLGRDLIARCEKPDGWDYCYGYVVATYDATLAHERWLKVNEVCVPTGTSQGEMVDSVIGYLKANPREMESQAASVVIVALQRRFPCPG